MHLITLIFVSIAMIAVFVPTALSSKTNENKASPSPRHKQESPLFEQHKEKCKQQLIAQLTPDYLPLSDHPQMEALINRQAEAHAKFSMSCDQMGIEYNVPDKTIVIGHAQGIPSSNKVSISDYSGSISEETPNSSPHQGISHPVEPTMADHVVSDRKPKSGPRQGQGCCNIQ